MELIYLIVLLAALLAMNWRFLGLDQLFGGGRRRRAPRGPGPVLRRLFGPACRWRPDPMKKHDKLKRYVCAECGADAFTSDGGPPRVCRRSTRTARL